MADLQKISEEIRKHETSIADAENQLLKLRAELQKAIDQARLLLDDAPSTKKRGPKRTTRGPGKKRVAKRAGSRKVQRARSKPAALPEASEAEVLKAIQAGPKSGSSKTDVRIALKKDPGTLISSLVERGKLKAAGGQGAGKKYKAV